LCGQQGLKLAKKEEWQIKVVRLVVRGRNSNKKQKKTERVSEPIVGFIFY
tara:strand:+ start:684 stop:833 length:150 start_codon:yes stop_codon:yes gene_type:complete